MYLVSIPILLIFTTFPPPLAAAATSRGPICDESGQAAAGSHPRHALPHLHAALTPGDYQHRTG